MVRRLAPARIVAYGMGSLAAGLFYAFNNFALPLYLSFFTQNAIIILWLSSTRSFEQTIIQPIVGALSDRTWTRFGRRAPFFLVGMSFCAVLMFANGLMPHDETLLPLVVATIFSFSLLFNIGIDPYFALLADVTPSEQRGTVSGIANLFQFVGQVGVLVAAAAFFSTHSGWIFTAVGVALIIGFGIVAFGVRESREFIGELHPRRSSFRRVARKDPRRGLNLLRSYFGKLWINYNAAIKLLGVRFIYQFGINAAVPIITLFVATQIGLNGWPEIVGLFPTQLQSVLQGLDAQSVALLVAAVFLLLMLVMALPVGLLGDRFGKKPVFFVGLIALGVSALFAAFATSLPQLLTYLIFLAFGNAIQTVLFFPYLTDLIPPDSAGTFAGLSATAETGGVIISAVVAGELINLNLFGMHYRTVFVLTGIFVLLAALAVLFVAGHFAEHGSEGESVSETIVEEAP